MYRSNFIVVESGNRYQHTALILGTELTVPVPTDRRMAESSMGYVFGKHLAIKQIDEGTQIRLRPGSGRGQSTAFDEFVGPELGALRRTLGRHLRLLSKEEQVFDEELPEQKVAVHVPQPELERMRSLVDAYVAENKWRFFISGHENIMRGAWTEPEWVEAYERQLVLDRDREDKLRKAQFDRDTPSYEAQKRLAEAIYPDQTFASREEWDTERAGEYRKAYEERSQRLREHREELMRLSGFRKVETHKWVKIDESVS